MLDDVISELGAFDFGRYFHKSREIVSDSFGGNRAVEALENHVRDFSPAHVAEHHFTAEHNAARIHFVLVGVFGRGAVSRFKDRMAGYIIDVATRRDADAPNLGGERITEVIAVEIKCRNDVEIIRTCEYLL